MTRFTAYAALSLSLVCFACSDDETSTATTQNQGGAGTGATGAQGGMGGATGGTGGSPTGPGGSGGGGGVALDCENLPDAPITATLVSQAFDGSEDIAFDGKGNLAGKNGNEIILLDGNGDTTALAAATGTVLGTRFLSDGRLIIARGNSVDQISTAGDLTQYVSLNGSPNGVFTDFEDNVWVTRFQGNEVVKIDSAMTVESIVMGADATSANGIVRHPTLDYIYYTEYGEANVHRVDISTSPYVAELIANIPGTALDGMTMDACGNLYVVDNGGNGLYRQLLDDTGAAVGAPELISTTATNVANGQFGSGPGWNDTSIYAAGFPGDLYEIPVGVPGAAIPTAP